MVKRVLSNGLVSFYVVTPDQEADCHKTYTTDLQLYECFSEKSADIKWLSDQIRALCGAAKHKNIVNILAYNFARKYQQ